MRESVQSSTIDSTINSTVGDVSAHKRDHNRNLHISCKNIVTNIRTTDVVVGLQRIPVGFFTVVQHSDLEWRTENKRPSVNTNVIEWDEPIPIPSDPSSTVCLQIYASFEFQPMLGNGELLRQLTITVEELLDRATTDLPFNFFPMDTDVVSPCSSVLVSVKPWEHGRSDSPLLKVLEPQCRSHGPIEVATDEGHAALLRYRKHGQRQDLERSIEQFEIALDICPFDHPCRAAVQSNLAMAKFIICQVDPTCVSLDVPLRFYRNVLSTRPIGSFDRPLTLIQLALAHLARFKEQKDEMDAAQAEILLLEAMNLVSANTYEKKTASRILRLFLERKMTQDSPSILTNDESWDLSIELLERYQRVGDLRDLRHAIAHLESLVKSTPFWDPRYPGMLQNHGTALQSRFLCLGDFEDLKQAIFRAKSAVELTPDDDPAKPARLTNLGTYFIMRFEQLGEIRDLEQAISSFTDAVQQTPDTQHYRLSQLNSLEKASSTRFNLTGDLQDLDRVISMLEHIARLIPDSHPDKPCRLNMIGESSLVRFECLGELVDLERAISRFAEAVQLVPDGHSTKLVLLNDLAKSLAIRFENLGDLGDLEQVISKFARAVQLVPDSHMAKPALLNYLVTSLATRIEHHESVVDVERAISQTCLALLCNLGVSFKRRFTRLQNLRDIERAISIQEDAVKLTTDDHPNRPAILNSLAISFRSRFNRIGYLGDIERAISAQEEAIRLTPDGHPDKPLWLDDLGSSILTRFERLGDIKELERAILLFTDAVRLIPDGHPDAPSLLNNFADSFLIRFRRLGDLGDLERAISIFVDAVRLAPEGHVDKPTYLNNLGNSLKARFENLGHIEDLEKAISYQMDAVQLTPNGDPDKALYLSSLGNSFQIRFERLGKLGDIEQAVLTHSEAVKLTPDGHSKKAGRINNLGGVFLVRFGRLGALGDLVQAISRFENAVHLTPNGHPDKPRRISNLGGSFMVRFKRLGELGDIERAISTQTSAILLTPDDHPEMPAWLNNLGGHLSIRFDRLGELADIERAVLALADAVQLTLEGHPDKPRFLNNLGLVLIARFEHLGEISDLERAISALSSAAQLTPDGHPDKISILHSLGSSFLTRFQSLRGLEDLERAISCFMDAFQLTPDGHVVKPALLNSISTSFNARFRRLGELNDLERAISMQKDAIHLTPDNHPSKLTSLNNLGDFFIDRFNLLGESGDLTQAICLYSCSAFHSTGPPTDRLNAALKWILCARASGHNSLLHAYSAAVDLLPQLAWIGLSLSHRYRELLSGADVVREAAAAVVESGHPEMAVEWLEQGRSIVWGDLFQLRSSYDELYANYPDHARRLRDLSTSLEKASHSRERPFVSDITQGIEQRATASLDEEAAKHRGFAIERDNLIKEIRKLPGFERFLLRKEFSQLRASAHSGPVVILNGAKSQCDALVVLANVENVIHVPLPNFNLERCATLQTSMKGLVRTGQPSEDKDSQWESILSRLWICVVKPVMDALGSSTIQDVMRIFWCPTGPFTFLPIHAAGLYDPQYSEPVHKVFDFVISSYVPTLSILLPSPKPPACNNNIRLLAVRQPSSDGLSHLPGVAAELKRIRAILADSSSTQVSLKESSLGTVEEVLDLMKDADWVHFACHGLQDVANPTNSGLCLADERRLKLSNIIELKRPHGGLAFLSACQTATGDKQLSDEAIHVAAGMLFAGYGGVVGTMWSISDWIAPEVAEAVYRQLVSNGTRPDYREAARALQDAVQCLREGGASFSEWIPFIHVGL